MLKRFRRRPEEPHAFSPQARYGGLSQHQFNQLVTYNGERGRGIMHTPEWSARMAALQRLYESGIRMLTTRNDDTPTD